MVGHSLAMASAASTSSFLKPKKQLKLNQNIYNRITKQNIKAIELLDKQQNLIKIVPDKWSSFIGVFYNEEKEGEEEEGEEEEEEWLEETTTPVAVVESPPPSPPPSSQRSPSPPPIVKKIKTLFFNNSTIINVNKNVAIRKDVDYLKFFSKTKYLTNFLILEPFMCKKIKKNTNQNNIISFTISLAKTTATTMYYLNLKKMQELCTLANCPLTVQLLLYSYVFAFFCRSEKKFGILYLDHNLELYKMLFPNNNNDDNDDSDDNKIANELILFIKKYTFIK